MMIHHPLLGPRDAAEFVYLGDASLIDRPDWQDEQAAEKFYDYLYLRDNPAGEHRELWYHEQGDRSWLVVTRDTLTHDIQKVELARDVARRSRKVEVTPEIVQDNRDVTSKPEVVQDNREIAAASLAAKAKRAGR